MGQFPPQRWRQQPQGPVGISTDFGPVTLLARGPLLNADAGPSPTSTGSVDAGGSSLGYSRSFNGSNQAVRWALDLSSMQACTVVMAFDRVITSGLQMLWEYGTDGVANEGEFAAYIDGSPNSSRLNLATRVATGPQAHTYQVPAGPQVWVVQYDLGATSQDKVRLWRNGVFWGAASVTSDSGSGTRTAFVGNRNLHLGSRNNASFWMNGRVALFGLLPGRRSAAELSALSENPWQLFRPLNRRIYSLPATGGSSIALDGSVTATATVSGALGVEKRLAASVSGTATVSGDLTISVDLSRPLAGSLTATATASGAINLAAALQASIAATATVTGDLAGGSAASVGAAGWDTKRRKRRIVVDVGGRALWFESVEEAQAAIDSLPQELPADAPRPKVRVRVKPAVKDAPKDAPAEYQAPQIDVSALQAWAAEWNQMATFEANARRQAQQYAAQRELDDDDEETLLMLL